LACQKHNQKVIHGASVNNDITKDSIFVKEGLVYKRVEIPLILYIEAKGSYSNIVTTAKTYTLSYNLNYFAGLVKNPVFKKVHRSYIVNINKVVGFDSTSLLINKIIIPVSKPYQKEIMDLFLKL
jgi:two-component system response regulator LytT